GSLDQAPALADRLAPEHLEIATSDPEALAARINDAGAIFVGRYTPEVIGDYVAGTNHVLPTARSARFASGLSVLDFMKRTSILKLDAEALAALGPAAMTLAEAEGLDAHRRSVAIRLNTAEVEHERDVAIFDLLEKNSFALEGHDGGPYKLHLSLSDNRLVFTVGDTDGAPIQHVMLSLSPFRRLVKDYFLICESYYQAIKTQPTAKIEAIDMGRRGLHDEGSKLLLER